MIRFLRLWLVPVLALMMLVGIAISFVPITQRAQERAESELTTLITRGFMRIGDGAHSADNLIAAQKDGLLSKAAAVARFLAHDDTLLDGDALNALCVQLSVDRIDVADAQGTLIASSDAERVDLPLGAQDAFSWTMAAADDTTAALAQADEESPSVLYACVGRQDIGGFVLLTRDDPYTADSLAQPNVEALISGLTYAEDVLFQSDAAGGDGFFRESGNLCLRKTQDGVTLIAARPTSQIFAVRNAMLLAFSVSLACIVICGVAAYLLRLEPMVALEEENPALNAAEEPAGLLPEEQAKLPEGEKKPLRRRRKKKRDMEESQEQIELPEKPEQTEHPEQAEQPEQAELAEQAEQDEVTAPDEQNTETGTHKPERVHRKRHLFSHDEEQEEINEDVFDKIVD